MSNTSYVLHEFPVVKQGTSRSIEVRNFSKAKRTSERSAADGESVLVVRSSDGERLSIRVDGVWSDFWAD